jgi:hypothetical protein
MVKQISNEEALHVIAEEMVELESKISKWNSQTDNLQMIDKWMRREEELICYRFEVVDAIKRIKDN